MNQQPNSNEFFFSSGKLNFKAKEGKKYYVEGYVATGDLDKGDDIITPEGLDNIYEQFEQKVLKLDYEHESLMGIDELDAQRNLTKNPLGKRVLWERDSKGVKIGWELNPTWKKFDKDGKVTMTTDDVWASVKGGFLDAFSIGYIPKEVQPFTTQDGRQGRYLKKVDILTSALTGTAMNPEATMLRAFAKSLNYLAKQEKNGENMTEKTQGKTNPENNSDDVTKEKALIEVKSRLEAIEKKNAELEAKAEGYVSEITELKSEITKIEEKSKVTENEKNELKATVEAARIKALKQADSDVKSAINDAEKKASDEPGSIINLL